MSVRNVIPAASAAITAVVADRCGVSTHTGYRQRTQYLKFPTVPAWRRTEKAAAGSAPHLRSNRRSGNDGFWEGSGQIRGPNSPVHPELWLASSRSRQKQSRGSDPQDAHTGGGWGIVAKSKPSQGYDLHLAIARPPSAHFLVSHKRKKFISEVYIWLFSQMQLHTLYSAFMRAFKT